MAAFAGTRGSGNWGTSERPQNFREGILWLNPNGSAPLFAMMSKSRKQSVNDPQFHWWEETLENARLKVNDASVTADTTSITVDAAGTTTGSPSGGLHLVVGDVVMVEKTETATYDNELMMVSAITSDTVVVFKRGIAGTTNATIADDSFLVRVGSAHAEGSSLPAISARNPTKKTNYTQIFRTVYGATKTADATFARTGDAYKNDRKRKMFDHSNKMEWAFLFGQASEDTTLDGTTGSPLRYTGGLREFLTTNVKIYTTSPTEDDFLDQISPVFDFQESSTAGNERFVLAGNGFLNNINKVARNSSSSRINFDGTIKLYGMELQKWVLPQGTLGIKTHPLMSTHARFTNSAFFLDFSNLIYRPLRDTRNEEDVQTPGEDTRKGHWITETGLEVQHEKTMAYLGNFVV